MKGRCVVVVRKDVVMLSEIVHWSLALTGVAGIFYIRFRK